MTRRDSVINNTNWNVVDFNRCLIVGREVEFVKSLSDEATVGGECDVSVFEVISGGDFEEVNGTSDNAPGKWLGWSTTVSDCDSSSIFVMSIAI